MELELTPKGELNYIDLDNDNPKAIQLEYLAITVVFFERAAQTYYLKEANTNRLPPAIDLYNSTCISFQSIAPCMSIKQVLLFSNPVTVLNVPLA
jgi:hypothetical protein